MNMQNVFLLIILSISFSCNEQPPSATISKYTIDTAVVQKVSSVDTTHIIQPANLPGNFASNTIETGNTTPAQLLEYAKTLQGIPYKYGSIDPLVGFDCSGFITYVFNHFNIAVPRSTIDFTNIEKEINLAEAKPGDIILYTGTDSTIRIVGHMGIITSNNNGAIEFIHSTSGKAFGVTITPLNTYYMGRFVKVIRVFKQND